MAVFGASDDRDALSAIVAALRRDAEESLKAIVSRLNNEFIFDAEVFTSLSILVNHLGAEPGHVRPAFSDDADAWFAMQVEASHDLQLPQWLSILTGALECHIAHHLFPDLPPNRLRQIREEIAQICRAHGVEHRRLAWHTAVLKAWQQVQDLGQPAPAVAASAG